MHRAWRRLGGIPWPDLVVASLLVAAAIVTTAGDHGVLHPVTEMVATITAAALVLRTQSPLLMAVIASAGCFGLALLPGSSTPLWAFATVLVLAFSAAEKLRGIQAAIALLLVLAATCVIQVTTGGSLVEMFATPPIIVGAPALAGWLLARERAHADRLRRLTTELAQERERYAALVTEAERARIARDLHDILAHTLSSIVVQAGAAQQLLAPRDPAREAVEHVMTAAHEGLNEVRSLLIDTRERQGDADPRPVIERLHDLVAADGAALTVLGAPAPAPVLAGVSLAAFRIAQEALTNARRHAPGRAVQVTLHYGPESVELTIENEVDPDSPGPRSTGPGLGIIGMVERAAAYSGTVESGPNGHGGWLVHARLPYDTTAGASASKSPAFAGDDAR